MTVVNSNIEMTSTQRNPDTHYVPNAVPRVGTEVVKMNLNKVDPKKAKNNKISTCKYRLWNFVFIFLFEQYQKIFNVVILLICVSNSLKFANVVSNMTFILPIIFVLTVAAIREIIEDLGRYRADQFTNNQKVEVVRNGAHQWLRSQDICQGDILLLRDGQEVPCDGVLLYSTDESKQASVSTASLDGESNLKQKTQLLPFYEPSFQDERLVQLLQKMRGVVATTPANSNMAQFDGKALLEVLLPEDSNVSLDQHESDRDESDLVFASREEGFRSPSTIWRTRQFVKRFSIDNVLLKGMRLQNIPVVAIGVAFTGMDSRLMKSGVKTKGKSSRIEQRLNKILLVMVAFLLVLTACFTLGSVLGQDYGYLNNQIWFSAEYKKLALVGSTRAIQYVIIASYLLPISLIVSLELARFFQSFQVSADPNLRIKGIREYVDQHGPNSIQESSYANMAFCQQAGKVNNSITVENLAEVDICFSDKTGTLTKNEMCFSQLINHAGELQRKLSSAELFSIGLCNTVIPRHKNDSRDTTITYQAESPDEIAFVEETARQGLRLTKRHATNVFYEFQATPVQKIELCFEMLAVIPFSSDRKRMSIIMKEKGTKMDQGTFYGLPEQIAAPGKPFIITKGADNIMATLCSTNPLAGHGPLIDKLSEQGLRTMVFATRQLKQDVDISLWVRQWKRIQQAGEASEDYLRHTSIVESSLQYLATTAIEDKLQDDVHDTLTNMRSTGIKIWMLTGDKTLTAISIARSSGLSKPDSTLMLFTAAQLKEKMEDTKLGRRDALNVMLYEAILTQLKMLESDKQRLSYNKQLNQKLRKTETSLLSSLPQADITGKHEEGLFNLPCTVVVDAECFRELLSIQQHFKLFQIAFSSQAVVCCRLSPQEKAAIVQFAHTYHPNMTTLAIGDGANDVSMIKAAQVGVGIAGKEGLHACNNADISVPEFRFLKRLVFVHGRASHVRNAELIEYSIYKNAQLVFANFLYQFYCKFSGQIVTESFLLMMFNTVLTFICIFGYAISEKDVYPHLLLGLPMQLKDFRKRYNANIGSIGKVLLFALYNALIMFFITKEYYGSGAVTADKHQDIYFFQSIIMMVAVFVSLVRVLIIQRTWTTLSFVALGLTLLVSYGTQFIGNFFTGFGQGQLGILQTVYSSPGPSLIITIESVLCLLPVVLDTFITAFLNPDVGQELMRKHAVTGCIREPEA